MFRFASPNYLLALYLLPLFVIGFIFFLKYKKKLLNRFADKALQQILWSEKSFLKESLKFSIVIISIGLLILAFSRPQIGSRVEDVKQIGIEVFILLDVSMSMKAEDLKPNRLDNAKNEISFLIKKLEGDKIGLIIFAGEAYIQFPLTTDYSAANLFLSAVDIGSVPQPGTAIASAINLAIKSFDIKSPTKKVIITITDGEDHEGDLESAIKNAVENDILLYAIGMGSSTGSPIPLYDSRGNPTDFKRDNNNNIVLTKLDESTLQKIANQGNGKYYLSSGYQNELDLIYSDLSKIEKSEFGSKRITDYEDKYYYFLFPAVLLLIIEFFITDRKSKLIEVFFTKYGISRK
jgi:Ca-activated chloride channel family protein